MHSAYYAAAATVTDIYDQPSSLVISAASNHKFVFVPASNISGASTLTFTFASQFTTSSITEDDVDIADDGVDLTTASNCAGAEQASVVMASNVLTITICAGNGGDIALGSSVVVEVGTNASASGSGTHQITNPSAAATYYITLGGTFGDSGSIPLPFVTSDTGGVSGTIVAPSNGGGGNGCGACGGNPTPTPEPTPTPVPDIPPVEPTPTPEPTPVPTPTPAPTPTPSPTPSTTPPSSSVPGTPTAEAQTPPVTAPVTPSETVNTPPVIGDLEGVSIIVDGGLALTPDGTTFTTLAGTPSTISVTLNESIPVTEARVIIDHVAYVLVANNGTYTANIVLPSADTALTVQADHADGTTSTSSYTLNVQGAGMVYEVVNKSWVPVDGAMVTVYQISGSQRTAWDATSYGAINPIIVGQSGAYSFYVPNGTYRITASHLGYQEGTSASITVTNHILAPSIELKPIVSVPSTAEPTSAIATIAAAVTTQLDSIRAIPAVQVATDIATPTTVVLAATSAIVLASSFSLLPYLQYLFTAPFLFFARRKRQAFGTVYNAGTKLPVDLAIVRLFSSTDHKLIRSVVTNQKGEYLLSIAAGTYTIEVLKPNFAFPSVILHGKKEDGIFLDIYTGQIITVSDQEATIAANIPLDPAGAVTLATPRHVAFVRLLRAFQQVIAIAGIVLAIIVLVITPTIFTAVMCIVQIIVYLFVRRLARVRKPKGWGIVYDEVTKQPVSNTVVRLFEPTYNKLIETVLTDRFGRYAFLVGPSQYYVSYSKPGYTEKLVRPVDFSTRTEPTALALDVPLVTEPSQSSALTANKQSS